MDSFWRRIYASYDGKEDGREGEENILKRGRIAKLGIPSNVETRLCKNSIKKIG